MGGVLIGFEGSRALSQEESAKQLLVYMVRKTHQDIRPVLHTSNSGRIRMGVVLMGFEGFRATNNSLYDPGGPLVPSEQVNPVLHCSSCRGTCLFLKGFQSIIRPPPVVRKSVKHDEHDEQQRVHAGTQVNYVMRGVSKDLKYCSVGPYTLVNVYYL